MVDITDTIMKSGRKANKVFDLNFRLVVSAGRLTATQAPLTAQADGQRKKWATILI